MKNSSLSKANSATSISLKHGFEHPWPEKMPRSNQWAVRADGRDIFVHKGKQADFAIITGRESVDLEVLTGVYETSEKLTILPPLKEGVLRRQGHRSFFSVESPSNLLIEAEGLPRLWLFVLEPIEKPRGENVLCLEPGTIHRVGNLSIESGQTVYLPEGAVLLGCVRASGKKDVQLIGAGIVDAAYPGWKHGARMSVVFDRCENVLVKGITFIHARYPNLVLGASRNCEVDSIHILSELISTDGIEVNGSTEVRINHCAISSNDDCIAVKAVNWDYNPSDSIWRWRTNTENVWVERCVLFNLGGGNVFEIGHETSCDRIGDIIFRDCDVLAKHGAGAVFSINNCDRALVENILYDNIRVFHYFDKLLSLRVNPSVYSDSGGLGMIQGVRFENLQIHTDGYNSAYSTSVIGGASAENPIKEILFSDIHVDGNSVSQPEDLQLFTRHVEPIRFLTGNTP